MFNPAQEMVSFGKEEACFLPLSDSLEWLVTNGIGGYGSGTVSGVLTRRYHGLLVAALKPPLDRTLLAAKFDEEAIYEGKEYPLSANRWASQDISPNGQVHIESFYLDGSIPVWNYACGDAIVEKRIWMEQGSNTTYVKYSLLRGQSPIKLVLKSLVNYRGYHCLTQAGNWRMSIVPLKNGLKIHPFDGAVAYYLLCDRGRAAVNNAWYHGYYLPEENDRGMDCVEDHLFAGTFQETLKVGESMTIAATTDPSLSVTGAQALQKRREYEAKLIEASPLYNLKTPIWVNQLLLAADQFIVARPLPDMENGKTIIAGYHWFTDWGRDTMISLPGLTLMTGRYSVAKEILLTFAKYTDKGMLPNQFPDGNEKPEYNTVDAALWYFEAVRGYFHATQDIELLKEIYPVLQEIIEFYRKGTRFSIQMDPKDGLIYAGEKGVQLTWMDAKIGNWVVTPRTGKAVEINALWYHALKLMSQFSIALGKTASLYDEGAEKVLNGFEKFWNESKSYCYDVIEGPAGNDSSLRPNQLLAVSLPFSPLNQARQKQVVDACAKSLLTSHGLRSLSPDDASYQGYYSGNQYHRDSVYHQGTVWAWLLGPFCKAHLKVYRDSEAAASYLAQIAFHVKAAGLGSCSEIFDGDAPMTPRGCIAQAWSVAQILEAWHAVTHKGEA